MTFEGATNLSIAPEYCMISTLYWVRPQPLTYMVEIVWILESKKLFWVYSGPIFGTGCFGTMY